MSCVHRQAIAQSLYIFLFAFLLLPTHNIKCLKGIKSSMQNISCYGWCVCPDK